MDKKFSFEQFVEAVVDKIREFLPKSFADARVELSTVTKNNNLRLTGLTIRSVDKNISPTIYLEHFYQNYMDGDDMSEVLERIADIRIKSDVNEFDVGQVSDFDRVQSRLVPKLINKAWNEQLLAERPYKEIADLAVVYQISLGSDFGGNASVTVTNQLLSQWGVDIDTVHELAVQNMLNLYPSTLEPMSKVLAAMMGEETAEMLMVGCPEDEMIWVISNQERANGGAAVLDVKLMETIAEKFGEEFYLIPSSIHEWLLVRCSEGMDASMIGQMIQEVNAEQVSQDERLSDHPYRYSIEEGLLPV